jgi:hypothetical protein
MEISQVSIKARQLVHLHLSTYQVPMGNETEMCARAIRREMQISLKDQWHVSQESFVIPPVSLFARMWGPDNSVHRSAVLESNSKPMLV